MSNFNPLTAQLFVAALRTGDKQAALEFALDITSDPAVVNTGIVPGKKYSDVELADLVETHIPLIQSSTVAMAWGFYIPLVIGAVSAWIADEVLGDEEKLTEE